MYKIIVALLLTLVVACTQSSPTSFATIDGQRVNVNAEISPGAFGKSFRLFINGDQVIDQRFKTFGGSSQNFNGSYRGNTVSARVTEVKKFFSNYQLVDVFYKGELVESLQI
ncbi:MAG: hypothetical protein AAFQ04_10950 [Pseudomonadota bacterium]